MTALFSAPEKLYAFGSIQKSETVFSKNGYTIIRWYEVGDGTNPFLSKGQEDSNVIFRLYKNQKHIQSGSSIDECKEKEGLE